MFALTIALLFGVVAGVVLYQTAVGYWRSEAGRIWQRLLDTARGSATILWIKACTFLSSIMGVSIYALDFFNFPGVQDWVRGVVKPEYLPFIGLAFLFVGFLARLRTL